MIYRVSGFIMNAHVEQNAQTLRSEMPAVFDGMKLAAVATVLYIIVRCLNLTSPSAAPKITCQNTPLNHYLLKSCSILTKQWVFTCIAYISPICSWSFDVEMVLWSWYADIKETATWLRNSNMVKLG